MMEFNCNPRLYGGPLQRPSIQPVAWLAALALCVFFAFLALATPALATEEWIEKLLEEKKELTEQLSGLKGKTAELERARDEYVETYHYLKRQEIRLQGFQLWNAFVGFISVAHDSLQKVNPGNSIVVATATFVQDRVGGAMDNPPLKAKVRTVSEAVKAIGPALTQLDAAIKMDKQQVADLLSARGMVDNTWVNLWNRNPEDVAVSKSVITGKITFIQERLGPAIQAIYKAKLELDGVIPMVGGQVKALEERLKAIDINIDQIRRHMELHNALEEARNIETPATETVQRWPAEPKAYGAALSAVKEAWNSLKGNSINGSTYRQLVNKAESDANAYYWEQLKPSYERYSEASNYFWNVMWPRLRTIEDADTRRSIYNAGFARLVAASDAYSAARDREYKALEEQFRKPMRQHYEEEKAERERWRAFAQRVEDLRQTPVDTYYVYSWNKTIERKTVPLKEVGLHGTSLAYAGWPSSWTMSYISRYMGGGGPPVWSLKDSTQKLEEWEKQMQELADFAKELYDTAKSADTQFSGFASEIDGLANELEPNRMVWDYLGWVGTSGDYYSATTLFGQMNMAMTIYNLMSKANQSTTQAWYDNIVENARKASQVKSVMQGSEALLEKTAALWELKKEAYDAYYNSALDRGGAMGRNFLFYNRITKEEADAVDEFVRSLNGEEEIEAHLFATLNGSSLWDWEVFRKVPRSIEDIDYLKKRFEEGDNAAANAYNRYESSYRAYNSAEKSLESTLSGKRSRLVDLYPGLMRLFYLESILNEVVQPFYLSWSERSAYNWYPPDPQDLAAGWPAAGPLFERLKAGRRAYDAKVDPVRKEIAEGFPKRAAKILAFASQARALSEVGSIPSEAAFRSRIDSLREKVDEIYSPLWEARVIQSGMAILYAYRTFNSNISWALSRMTYIKGRDNTYAQFEKMLEEAAGIAGLEPSEAGLEKAVAMLTTLDNNIRPGSTLAYYAAANEPAAQPLLERGREMVAKLNDYIVRARMAAAQALTTQVQEFYRTFASTYEQRNAGAVVRLMDDRWTASDGTDIVDVEEMLDNSFSVFDRVEYRIENLTVTPRPDGKAAVTYNVTIVGRILRQDLVHEEKSTVNDILEKKDGSWRIVQTLGGRFWK